MGADRIGVMAFVGVAPVSASTLVGQTRSLIGDDQYEDNYDGTGNFGYFSDEAIQTFLIQGSQNPLMATGFAYLKLSAQAAFVEANIATDDLKYSDVTRSQRLEQIANDWFARANNVEWFSLTPTGDETIDIREYIYPSGRILLSEIFYETPASILFPDWT